MTTGSSLHSPDSHGIDFLVNGRRAKTQRLTLSEKKTQLALIVNKVPEVLIKVSGGGKTVQHVLAHMDYITRNGKLEAVTDQGENLKGKNEIKELHDSWDLDACNGQGKFRQAFNIILSMPMGTDSAKLFKATQNFARDEFYGKHQYLMVLHTPENDPHKGAPPHPHVHLIVKAEDLNGKRLYIRKATLEEWRTAFAVKLREQGIEANATPREIRGKVKKWKTAALHHVEKRGHSMVMKNKFEEARQELISGNEKPKPWELAILNRRKAVLKSLGDAAKELRKEGDELLATAVERYANDLPRPETERHQIKRALVTQIQRTRQPSQPDIKPNGNERNQLDRE